MRAINITSRFLTGIVWLEQQACDFIIDDKVDVWSIAADTGSTITDMQKVISPDELNRANRFFRQQDRDRFIRSRWALRNITGKYIGKHPAEVEFEAGLNKKPHIKNAGINLHYNMSHSGAYVLLVIAGSAIGADLEFINNDFGYIEVLGDNFSTDEVKYINEAEHIDRFFKLWTRKEAITKATAQGLDCDLRLLPGLDGTHKVEPGIIASDEDWVINSFIINGKYAASVANSPSTGTIAFYSL